MTIILDISPETETLLRERAMDEGQPMAKVAIELIEAGLHAPKPLPASPNAQAEEETFSDYLERIGVRGAVESRPRADGRSWSEIEAACDTD